MIRPCIGMQLTLKYSTFSGWHIGIPNFGNWNDEPCSFDLSYLNFPLKYYAALSDEVHGRSLRIPFCVIILVFYKITKLNSDSVATHGEVLILLIRDNISCALFNFGLLVLQMCCSIHIRFNISFGKFESTSQEGFEDKFC